MLSEEMRAFYRQSVSAYKTLPPTEDPNELVERSAALIGVAYGNRRLDDDGLQSCMAKLSYAARLFDASKGYQWSTYAVNTLKRHLINEFRRKTHPDRDESRLVKNAYTKTGKHILDSEADFRELGPLASVEKSDIAAALNQMVMDLPYHMRDVVVLKYGLQGNRPHTFREIAAIQGLSRQRIEQISSQALERLREKLA